MNISKQKFLSALFGICFANLSFSIIHWWLKYNDKKKNYILIDKHTFKKVIKVKRKYVPTILQEVPRIEEMSSTSINFEDNNLQYPDCTCTITGTKTNIDVAVALIESKTIDTEMMKTYEIIISAKNYENIITLCESNLSELEKQKKRYVNIIIEKPLLDNKMKILIQGYFFQIVNTFDYLEIKLKELKYNENEVLEEEYIRKKIEGQEYRERKEEEEKPMIKEIKEQKYNEEKVVEEVPMTKEIKEQEYNEKKVEKESMTKESISPVDESSKIPIKTQGELISYDKVTSLDVYVTRVSSYRYIYFRLVSENEALRKLHADMAKYYKNILNRQGQRLDTINRGDIVAAKCKNDGQWYRAEVIDIYMTYVNVHYIDSGYKKIIHQYNVLGIPKKFLQLRAQAIRGGLIFIGSHKRESGSQNQKKRIKEIINPSDDNIVRIRGYERRLESLGKLYPKNSPFPLIELYNKGGSVNENLASKGLAHIMNEEYPHCYVIPWTFTKFSNETSNNEPIQTEPSNNEFDLSKEIYVHSDDEDHIDKCGNPEFINHDSKYAFPDDDNGGWYSVEVSDEEYFDNGDWYRRNGYIKEFINIGGERSEVKMMLELEELLKEDEFQLYRRKDYEDIPVGQDNHLYFPGSRFTKVDGVRVFDDRPTSQRVPEIMHIVKDVLRSKRGYERNENNKLIKTNGKSDIKKDSDHICKNKNKYYKLKNSNEKTGFESDISDEFDGLKLN
ncbi:tudor and KH domain-containing protein homolog [Vespa crabro]|uniref:tudor and KH domain-containing protein homolog n=1 Tax=Vespa crabro TaxID=7445 RepID=UPI001F006876|nr:tudor and KH domain-containing protein homolog [Vespa crabro]